jgi:hypothetical protein
MSGAAMGGKANNRRTALVLATVALAFFFGIMLKYWLLR